MAFGALLVSLIDERKWKVLRGGKEGVDLVENATDVGPIKVATGRIEYSWLAAVGK